MYTIKTSFHTVYHVKKINVLLWKEIKFISIKSFRKKNIFMTESFIIFKCSNSRKIPILLIK